MAATRTDHDEPTGAEPTTKRIHRTNSSDGTEIVARVHGTGPPLVLVHGGFGDGERSWQELLPELVDRFTCFSMSTRGRGLSGPAADPSVELLVDDVVSVVESIGSAVPVFGLSMGAILGLAAAQRTGAVGAVVAYEPGVFQVMDDVTAERFVTTVATVAELAAAGRPADAARAFHELVTNGAEQDALAATDLYSALAANVQVQLDEFAALAAYEGPSTQTPEALATISAPVLLLHGTESVPQRWFADSIDHVARHVPRAQVRTIDGTGHLGPVLHPATIAGEIAAFLAPAAQPTP